MKKEVDALLIDDIARVKDILKRPSKVKISLCYDTITASVVIIEVSLLKRIIKFVEKEIK